MLFAEIVLTPTLSNTIIPKFFLNNKFVSMFTHIIYNSVIPDSVESVTGENKIYAKEGLQRFSLQC